MARRMGLAAAGTGGHILPAVEVGEVLEERGWSVCWIGRDAPLDHQLVPDRWSACWLKMRGVFGGGWRAWVSLPWVLLVAIWQAWRFLKTCSAVLVMGGYVTVPVVWAARLRGIPVFMHEQNAVMGRANRLMMPWAHRVFLGLAQPTTPKALWVGNPIRRVLRRACESRRPESGERLRCLVLGGSQGAQVLNERVHAAWSALPPEQRPALWHQVGARHHDAMQAAYASLEGEWRCEAYVNDMLKAYQWADVVVARAGALTVSELVALSKTCLLVPYPYAVDDHQRANARVVSHAVGVSLCEEAELTESVLQAWWAQGVHGSASMPPEAQDWMAAERLVNEMLEVLKG